MSAMLLAVGFTAAAQAPASLKDTYKKAFVIGAAVNAAQIQGEINERAVNAGLFRCKLGKIKQLIFMAERLGFPLSFSAVLFSITYANLIPTAQCAARKRRLQSVQLQEKSA